MEQQEMAKNPGISCSRRKLLPFLGLKGKEEGAVIGIFICPVAIKKKLTIYVLGPEAKPIRGKCIK